MLIRFLYIFSTKRAFSLTYIFCICWAKGPWFRDGTSIEPSVRKITLQVLNYLYVNVIIMAVSPFEISTVI